MQKNQAHREMVAMLSAIWREGDVRELRAFSSTRGWVTFGYFDDPLKMAENGLRLWGTHDLYVTLNPVKSDLMARCANRTKEFVKGRDKTTSDKEIAELRYVLVDLDPEREKGISSTGAELEIAKAKANEIRKAIGNPVVMAMSGNGVHLIYRHNAETAGQVKAWLHSLHERFSDDQVKVDLSVFNPARISKLIGSWSRKGDSTTQRPHRASHMIEALSDRHGGDVDLSQVEVVEDKPKAKKDRQNREVKPLPQNQGAGPSGFDVVGYLAGRGVTVKESKAWDDGVMHVLDCCVFDSQHNRGESSVIECGSGKIIYQCHHDSCKGYTWQDVRGHLDGPKPQAKCHYCNEPIAWVNGQTRPNNLDGSLHSCSGPRGQQQQQQQEQRPKVQALIDDNDKAADLAWCRQVVTAPRFPVEALPPLMGQYAHEISKSMSSPVDYAGTFLLTSAAAAIGGNKQVEIGGDWREHASLYSICVGAPGSKKSPVFKAVLSLMSDIEKTNRDKNDESEAAYIVARAEYDALLAKYKADIKAGNSATPPDQPDKVIKLRFHTSNATVEALAPILSDNSKVLLAKDEVSELWASMNQYKGGQGSDRQSYLSFWAGAPAPIDRKGQETIYLSSPCVSIMGGIQPEEMHVVTRNLNDGLFDRFLVAFPEPVVSFTRSRASVDKSLKDRMRVMFVRLYSDGEDEVLKMADEAVDVFDMWYEMNAREAHDMADTHASVYHKAPAQCLRIALVLSIIKHEKVVSAYTVTDAVKLVEYYKAQTDRVLGMAAESADERALRKVVELVKKRGADRLTTREVCRAALLGIRKAAAARDLLLMCASRGLGKFENKALSIDMAFLASLSADDLDI